MGAFETHGAIRDKWASMGWETSWLGYPVSDEQDYWSHDFEQRFYAAEFSQQSEVPKPKLLRRKSYFQNGVIVWEPGTGVTVMKRKAVRSPYEPLYEVVDPKPT